MQNEIWNALWTCSDLINENAPIDARVFDLSDALILPYTSQVRIAVRMDLKFPCMESRTVNVINMAVLTSEMRATFGGTEVLRSKTLNGPSTRGRTLCEFAREQLLSVLPSIFLLSVRKEGGSTNRTVPQRRIFTE